MVDTGTYNKEEKTECPKKTIKEHVPQNRGRPVKRYTTRKKPGIRHNKKGKTKIVEGILQLNTKHQSMGHSLQVSDK